MDKKTIHNITLGGVLAAATVLLTTVVSIPIPGGLGYINLGDAAVLTAATILGSPWGVLCGGVASALSDLLLGYGVYAPATLVIKSAMAAMLLLLLRVMPKKLQVVSFFLASLCVPAGYLLYETILYGFASAVPNFGFNLLQGLIGAAAALLLANAVRRIYPTPKQNRKK